MQRSSRRAAESRHTIRKERSRPITTGMGVMLVQMMLALSKIAQMQIRKRMVVGDSQGSGTLLRTWRGNIAEPQCVVERLQGSRGYMNAQHPMLMFRGEILGYAFWMLK